MTDGLPSTSSAARDPRTATLAALHAVSRLLALASDGSQAEIHETLVEEARAALGAATATVLVQEPGRRLAVAAGDAPETVRRAGLALDDHRGVAELLDRRVRMLRVEGERARDLAVMRADATPPAAAVLVLLRVRGGHDQLLVLTDPPAGFEGELAVALADAAAAGLDRLHAVAEHRRQVARQQALTRAAKTLNSTLELDTVLTRICHEAAALLGVTTAAVYRGSVQDGLTMTAAFGVPPEDIGYHLPTGAGLAGRVLQHRRAMYTNDYSALTGTPPGALSVDFVSAMAAPMSWDGELRGVLSVAWPEDVGLTHEDLAVLETFAELAMTACGNASAHAGLALAARTDGLTGCLNHAALHEGLRREIERAVRAADAEPLSLILIDLDHFKQVNEAHGHLAGDEVLRRAGHALRHATRPYDLAARYGGDEFALLAVQADEETAIEMGRRAVARISAAIGELLPDGATAATAGVAEWSPGVRATELVARADRALLFAKQEGFRGSVQAFSGVPDRFRPGRFARTDDRHMPDPPPMPRGDASAAPRSWPDERRPDERLRKRTRQLALANALGARVAGMTDCEEIMDAAVDELHRAFGFFCAAVIRLRPDGLVEAATLRGAPFLRLLEQRWCQPRDVGLIGRCLRTRRPVLSNDVHAEAEYQVTPETSDVRSEIVVPLFVGDQLWGAINVEETAAGAFDADDLMLLQTVAAQIGSAMRSAALYQELEQAYLGTAEALAELQGKRKPD